MAFAGCSQIVGERVLWAFPVHFLVTTSEVAAAVEAHRYRNVANTGEALARATGWIQQQLPNAVHADGALQLKRCLVEMFFGASE